jgi:hypothetical protein
VDDENVVQEPSLTVYYPLRQMGLASRLFVRAAGDPYALVPSLTRTIRGISADQAAEQRQERRLDRARQSLAPIPIPRRRERDAKRPDALLPVRKQARRDGQLELFTTARRSLRVAQGNTWVARWLRFGRRGVRWQQDPERAARRAVFRLASRTIPTRMHEVLCLLRGLRGLGVRQR